MIGTMSLGCAWQLFVVAGQTNGARKYRLRKVVFMLEKGHVFSSARTSVLVFSVNSWSKVSLGLRFVVAMVTLSVPQA